jgi:3-hydroxybutyryl-CoA dehydrogenase
MATRFVKGAVIGTGMMGPGTAMTLALGGVRTVIVSRTEEGAARGLRTALAQLSLLEQHGLVEAAKAGAARELLSSSASLEQSVADADIVNESVLERMELKQELFERLDGLAKPEAALTSNTSGLSITVIASRCERPERVMTTHFWNPPHLIPLVEVVCGEKTDRALALEVKDLLARCGKVPVMVKKDRPGQLGNRMQMALVREAINILQEGIADAADVDLAVKTGFGMRLPVYGVLEHQDIVGLDLGSAVLDYVTRDLNNEPGMPKLTRELMEKGHLGVKAGRGYYDWSKKDAEAIKARRDRFLLEFLKNWKPGE